MLRDFFLDKQREKAKLELEMKLVVTLKQRIPAGEASREGSLGVILSQYYLNINDFCKDFNDKTKDWLPGVPLPVKVIKTLRGKEYNLSIGSPTIPFLIETAISPETFSLEYVSLYDAIKFKAKLLKKPLKPVARMFFSSLHSKHIRRIII